LTIHLIFETSLLNILSQGPGGWSRVARNMISDSMALSASIFRFAALEYALSARTCFAV